MDFAQAINSLKDGQAAKIGTWGGYAFRTNDEVSYPEYNPETMTGYQVGFIVMYDGDAYKCIKEIPSGSEAGFFSFMNWERFDNLPFSITFRERSGSRFTTSATYDDSGNITFSDFTPNLNIDGQLFAALVSDNWVVGEKDDFEQAVSGDSRW